MILLEDTRNVIGKHILKNKYFAENGIEVRRTKLYVGDYTLPDNQSVCIDSKKDIQELIGDICGKQHERFRAECERAKEAGIKLIVLVENEDGYLDKQRTIYNNVVRSIKDLHSWKNPRLFIMRKSNELEGYYKNGKPRYKRKQAYPNATRGTTIAKACMTMEKKYDVEFVFCTPDEAGAKIVELLT